jgi:hypothetical protein
MWKRIAALFVLAASVALSGCSTTSLADQAVKMFANDSLVSGLTSNLGLTSLQAAGGLGSVMSLASSKLNPTDYASLGKVFGNSKDYLSIAEKAGVLGKGNPIKDIAGLNSAFGTLGISPETGAKMLGQVSDYAGSAGGDAAKGLLKTLF